MTVTTCKWDAVVCVILCLPPVGARVYACPLTPASYVDYKNIAKNIQPGETIFIDDGTLEFKVLEALDSKSLRARALISGTLYSRKGVNLPDTDLDLPFLCDKDKADLAFGVEHGVDMIFASFVHSAEDIREVRRELGEKGRFIPVIAKIEDQRGLYACEEIIAEADGAMVARGDLGIELPHSEVRHPQHNTPDIPLKTPHPMPLTLTPTFSRSSSRKRKSYPSATSPASP